MIRWLATAIVLLAAIAACAMYLSYSTIDPCEALAIERARRSPLPTGFAKPLTELSVNGLSRTECTADLLGSWHERLDAIIHR